VISLMINLGRSDLVISSSNISPDHYQLVLTEKGEHQDDPKHHYYKPDVIVNASMRKTQIAELIDGLQRLL